MPKRECVALKSPLLACKGLKGPGEPHPVTLQTAVDGIWHADQGDFVFSSRGWDGPRNNTSSRSLFREAADDGPATVRDHIKEYRSLVKCLFSNRLWREPRTNLITSHQSPGVCETADWPATARDGIDRIEQAV